MIVNLCSQCGKECLRKKQYRGTRYFCSDKCKYTLYNGIKQQKRELEKVIYTKVCTWVNCEKEFSTNQPNKKYCSASCMQKVLRATPADVGKEFLCIICESPYKKYQSLQRVCSGKCSRRYEKLKSKQRIYDHYGRKCNCRGCSETEQVFLTIDHVNNDGHLDKGTNFRGGDGLYRKVIRENFPDSYQVLCHNCNWAKQYGECPHNKTNT